MDAELGRAVVAVARRAIAEELGLEGPPAIPHRALDEPGASFVTLTRGGDLRGCIGSLEAHRPLGEDVASNARAAAFSDPRFPPLTLGEHEGLEVEVSLLSALEPLRAATEAEALERLRPGRDGLVFEAAGRRATFLPQVWAQLPSPRTFLGRLRAKAGLPEDYWSPGVRLWRYTVESSGEGGHHG